MRSKRFRSSILIIALWLIAMIVTTSSWGGTLQDNFEDGDKEGKKEQKREDNMKQDENKILNLERSQKIVNQLRILDNFSQDIPSGWTVGDKAPLTSALIKTPRAVLNSPLLTRVPA